MTLFKKLSISTLCLITLSGCSWFGGDKDAVQPHPLVTFAPALSVTKMWDAHPNDGAHKQYLLLHPAVQGRVVYSIDYRGYVNALNTRTGRQMWRVKTKLPFSSGVVYHKGYLLMGTSDGRVVALHASDGKLAWNVDAGNEVLADPGVSGNRVAVETIDGHIVMLDLITGKKLWDYDNGAPTLILRGGSTPQFAGNKVLAGFSDGHLMAFNVKTGKPIWNQVVASSNAVSPLGQMVDIDVNPIVIGQQIYVATYQGRIAKLDLETGHFIWKHDLSSYTGITYNKQDLFISDSDGNVWAFKRSNGEVIWRQKDLLHRGVTAPVAMGNDIVVGDAEGYLHWMLQSDGHFLVRQLVKKKTSILAAPVVVGHTLYVQTKDGRIFVYRTTPLRGQ